MKNDMELNDKKVLIVGMDDFLGVHLVEALLAEGAHVRIYDHSGSDKRAGEWREHLLSTNANILPRTETTENLPVGGIYDAVKNTDVVYHLERFSPDESRIFENGRVIKSRYAMFMETLNLLLACREVGVSRIVQISSNIASAEKYPEKPAENDYLDMIDLNYEKVRCDIEDLSRNFYSLYGLPIVMVHAQYAFGPRQGKWEIIPAMMDQAIKGKRTLRLKAANTAAEFTYISDVVQGLLLAGSVPGLEGMKFELSAGQKVTYSELADLIAAKLGLEFKVVFDSEKKTGVRSLERGPSGDGVNGVHKIPGWDPKVHLDKGLDKIIEWMKSASKE